MSKATQDALLTQLKNPFDPKFLKWRVGATNKDKTKGIALAYLDAREIYKRLDDVCGIAGWQNTLKRAGDGFICEISIKIDGEWITKSNAAGDTRVEALKGGSSDALKRAAAAWGIGRYLYYLPNKWVALDSYKNLTEIPELPDWAIPKRVERWEDVALLEQDMQGSDPVESVHDVNATKEHKQDIIEMFKNDNNTSS